MHSHFQSIPDPLHVAVVDPYSEGHHLPWAAEFCASLLSQGYKVTALFPETHRLQQEVVRICPGHLEPFEVYPTAGFAAEGLPRERFQRAGAACSRWATLNGILRGLPSRPAHVFHAYLDCMLAPGLPPAAVDSVFRFPWSGLYLHPVWTRLGRRLPFQLREGWALRSRKCQAVALLDEGLVSRFRTLLPHTRIVQMPDFLSRKTEASVGAPHAEIISRARGRTIVGLVGTLQSRKGLATLLRVALNSKEQDFFFVIAGQLTLENFAEDDLQLIRDLVSSPPENCFIHTAAIPCESEFMSIAQACDILFAAYHNFPHSSNILALASLLRKPVVVSGGYLMEERVRKYHLGKVVPQNDPQATLHAIHELREGRTDQVPDFSSYLSEHSRARLDAALQKLIHHHDQAASKSPEAGSAVPTA